MRVVWSSMAILVLSSAAGAQATLTGYVRDDESLRGLQGVELSIDGTDKRVRTDKEGKYVVKDLTAGAIRVHLRSVGFAPIDTILTLDAGKPTESVFFLSKHAVTLDTVKTRDNRVAGAGFASFEIRRSKGFGKFMDSVFLREHENVPLPDLIRNLGTVEVAKPGTCHGSRTIGCNQRVAVKPNRGDQTQCLMQVVLDGAVVAKGQVIEDKDAPPGMPKAVVDRYEQAKQDSWGVAFDLNSIGASALRGVELYRSGADAQEVYGGGDAGCGVLVLWTRR